MARPARGRWVLTCVLVALGLAALIGLSGAVTADAHTVEEDVQFGAAGGFRLTADITVPDTEQANRGAVVLAHGGAWVGGDKAELADTAAAFADEGYLAVSVDYRLAPDASVADQVQDLGTAVAWLRAPEQTTRYRLDPDKIGVFGVSAGGHLATLLAQRETPIGAVVSWSGVYDLRPMRYDDRLLGCEPRQCPEVAAEASPVAHVTPTMAPTLLVSSSGDRIVSFRQLEDMQGAMEAGGAVFATFVVEGDAHADGLRDSAWPETIDWLDQHLGIA